MGEQDENLSDQNVSLYVSWNDDNFYKTELDTFASKCQENIQSFREQKKLIQAVSPLKLPFPVETRCSDQKTKFLNEKHRILQSVEDVQAEYKALCLREVEIRKEIAQVEDECRRCAEQEAECKRVKKVAKDKFLAHKIALNMAKSLYEASFGMEATVEEGPVEHTFVASVCFTSNSNPVKLTINRKTNKITDVDFNSLLTKVEEEKLRALLKQTSTVDFVCQLRKQILKKL